MNQSAETNRLRDSSHLRRRPAFLADAASTDTIRLEIPRSTRYIAIARKMIEEAGSEAGLPKSEIAEIRLAVGEACNNAVFHGQVITNLHEGSIRITCRIFNEALEIDVSNEGDCAPPRFGMKMPEPLAEHGRGLALIEAMVDDVEMLSHHGMTTLRMRKHLTPKPTN